MTHPVENIMKTTMEQLKAMADVNTIVGNPILTAGETMILPVSRLSMGFISGGGEYGPEKKKSPIQRSAEEMCETSSYPFAGAAVAGMTITPMAFLSVNNGCVKVMPADYNTTFDRAVEILPELIGTVEQAIKNSIASGKADNNEMKQNGNAQ